MCQYRGEFVRSRRQKLRRPRFHQPVPRETLRHRATSGHRFTARKRPRQENYARFSTKGRVTLLDIGVWAILSDK